MEIGPIRPPSEAGSLLLRLTRSCPWNRCHFCPVYRGTRFAIRDLAEVEADLAAMERQADALRELSRRLDQEGAITSVVLRRAAETLPLDDAGLQVARFLAGGGRAAFLQDANSLVVPVDDLLHLLGRLRETFPTLSRITTYARAHTLTRRSLEQLTALRETGLTRVHVGLESGSARVLELVRKGVDPARQIEAGRRARAAGMELSEYVMPGLGGRAHWREHAVESARVLSAIDPHFIRLRTTAVPPGTGLAELVAAGRFDPLDDEEVVAEIRLFLEHLEVSSCLQSDHVLNLLPELEGQLPGDKPRLLGIVDRFLEAPPELRRAFILARRAGLVQTLAELEHPPLRDRLRALEEELAQRLGADYLRLAVRELMLRFI